MLEFISGSCDPRLPTTNTAEQTTERSTVVEESPDNIVETPYDSVAPISKTAENRHSQWLEDQWRKRFLILPDSQFERNWDALVSVASLASVIKVPVDIAFGTPEGWQRALALNVFMDVIFIMDIVFNFRRCFRTRTGVETDLRVIRNRYLRGWFLLDVIPAIPIDPLAALLSDSHELGTADLLRATNTAKFLRLPRLLRLLRLFRLFRAFSMSTFVSAPAARVLMLCFLVLLFIHWGACFEYLMAVLTQKDGDFLPTSWPALNKVDRTHVFATYTDSLFRSFLHMLCIGYGPHPPGNMADTWVTMVVMFLGALMYATVVGSVAAHFSSNDSSRATYNRMTDMVTDWLHAHEIRGPLAQRVRAYFQHRYPMQRAFNDDFVLGLLSSSLQLDLKQELYMSFLWQVEALRAASEPVLRALCQKLRHSYHVPGDVLIAKGDVATSMFITRQGELVAVDAGGRYMHNIVEGEMFGFEAFVAAEGGERALHSYTVVCEAHCESLELPWEAYSELYNDFPEWSDIIHRLLPTKVSAPASAQSDACPDPQLAALLVEAIEHIKTLQQTLSNPQSPPVFEEEPATDTAPLLTPTPKKETLLPRQKPSSAPRRKSG
eukprot:NODE_674_length_1958_cov_43.728017_g625_i0.p1 GENE.NODE_674_length_1958_cov_43.728017_g625_i0~~NODE_674_length_1958_cov_43.728017_g625_i0.p1  ORF type:complete len:621 (-),score=143.70 NODE_674_length_1958_cov_43.728017_g625_i0:96-1916(-)